MLVYYAVANASAFTLPAARTIGPRVLPALGLAGCLVLALTLPSRSVVTGASVLVLGMAVYALRHTRNR